VTTKSLQDGSGIIETGKVEVPGFATGHYERKADKGKVQWERVTDPQKLTPPTGLVRG
jgi:hypothetical protein